MWTDFFSVNLDVEQQDVFAMDLRCEWDWYFVQDDSMDVLWNVFFLRCLDSTFYEIMTDFAPGSVILIEIFPMIMMIESPMNQYKTF